MPAKKKSKPSFQVPEELQKAPQAGWVYRSDEQAPVKEAKAAGKPAAKPKATASAAPAKSQTARPAETKPRGDARSNSSSDSSYGILDLTARTISAGFGAAGNLMLLTTRIIAAPVSLGRRMLGI